VPLAIYKTVDPHKYLQMRLPKLFLDVCENSDCQTHVSGFLISDHFLVDYFVNMVPFRKI